LNVTRGITAEKY